MGLGPAACEKCSVPGSYVIGGRHPRWVCPKCLSTNLQGSMGFDWNSERVKKMQENLVELYKPREEYNAKVRKPFSMPPNDYDPNVRLRPWLEENVGKQGEDWDWILAYDNSSLVEVFFADKELAVLFELTCI